MNRQEAAVCGRKELDLQVEMTGVEWATAQKDWARVVRIHPGDMLVCVWFVHLCCGSVWDSMGIQWLAVETQEHAHYGFEDFD